MKTTTWIGSLLALALLLMATNASALPAFARKNNMQCSACHTAYPALTAFGRQFKEAGYRLTGSTVGDVKISKHLQFDKNVPMSLRLIGRPYTDTQSGPTEIRAIHEGELYAGGEVYKNISGFLEVESEGEDGFGLVLATAQMTYNRSRALNVQVGYGPTLMADPYSTYADKRRLTATHYEMLNQKFGQADNDDKLRHSRQQVSVYGRVADGKLFYNVGYGGVTGEQVGTDAGVVFGRLAYDISPKMMLGVMTLQGTCKNTVANCAPIGRDFSRTAIDGQFDFDKFRFTAVYMQAKDDNASGVEQTNNSYYVQGSYRFLEEGRPTFVPLVRLEDYELNDGADKYSLATVNLGYYFAENVKGFLEYRDTYDTPTGVPTDNATTLQVEVVF